MKEKVEGDKFVLINFVKALPNTCKTVLKHA